MIDSILFHTEPSEGEIVPGLLQSESDTEPEPNIGNGNTEPELDTENLNNVSVVALGESTVNLIEKARSAANMVSGSKEKENRTTNTTGRRAKTPSTKRAAPAENTAPPSARDPAVSGPPGRIPKLLPSAILGKYCIELL